jgi:NADH oxidase (H2O2-forming)
MGFSLTDDKQIIIIGCGAAGGTAAQFARKTNRKANIAVFEKGMYPQYSKCGLPYVISGDIVNFNHLIEFPKEWFEKEQIYLSLDSTVEKIDTEKKIVIVKKENEQIKKKYDRLIIATGAKPSIPQIDNIQKNGMLINNVYVLRTIDDGKKIYSQLKKNGKATVIGAGLIGLEIAESLHKKGMKVSVIESLPNILANTLDSEMGQLILKKLEEKINIYPNHWTQNIKEKNGKICAVIIKDTKTNEEKRIDTDILIVATGTKPDVTLAKDIGCRIGKNGGIIVNEKTETTISGIYAIGDCTEYIDYITTDYQPVGLGSIAVRQGIASGINAAGGTYNLPKGFLSTRTSELFGIEIAAVGPVKNACQKIPIIYGKFKGSSLPDYFPGGKPITMKVGIHEETGVILTAQAIGDNAAQRINTMTCAIQNKMNVQDMKKLETAYAPPIAATLDVLTLVCDVAFLKLIRRQR